MTLLVLMAHAILAEMSSSDGACHFGRNVNEASASVRMTFS
jgi:hypothetical protein